jgi:hypothetical protein
MTELSFADEVRAFLAEFGQTKNALDGAVYPSFAYRLLLKGRSPAPATVARARAWMAEIRDSESEEFRKAVALIRADEGYITLTPGGDIEKAPAKVTHFRLHRMIEQGWLVPTGDALLAEVHSQSYKLSSLAQ